jgi:hypothetical protein
LNLKHKLNIHIIAVIAAFMALPLLFQYMPSVDCATRYAPMAKAFANGNITQAFHSRFLPLFPILTGSVTFILGCSGYFACKFICWMLFWLSVYPVYYIALTLGQSKRLARYSGLLMAFCYPLMALIGEGTRANLKSFLLLYLSLAILKYWQNKQSRYLFFSIFVAACLSLTRGDAILYVVLVLSIVMINFILYHKMKLYYQPLLACLLFSSLLAPWLYWQYHTIGYPVIETRHALLLDKLAKSYPIIKSIHHVRSKVAADSLKSYEKKNLSQIAKAHSTLGKLKQHKRIGVIDDDNMGILQQGGAAGKRREYHKRKRSTSSTLILIGNGDFNGDSVLDALWVNDKRLEIWYSGNKSSRHLEDITTLAEWQLIGIGKFANTTTSDILWQNIKSGVVGIWHQGKSNQWQCLGAASRADWQITGIEDIIGDNRSDILWENIQNGQIGVWKNGQSSAWQQLNPSILKKCQQTNCKYDSIVTVAKIIAKQSNKKQSNKKHKKRFASKLFRGLYPLYAIAALIGFIIAVWRKKWHQLDSLLLLLYMTHLTIIIGQIFIADSILYVSVRYLVVTAPLLIPWATKAFWDLYMLAGQYIHKKIKYLLIITYISVGIGAYGYGVKEIIKEYGYYANRTDELKQIAQLIRSSSLPRKAGVQTAMSCNFYSSPTILSEERALIYYCQGKLLSIKNLSEQRVDFIITKNSHNQNLPLKQYKDKIHQLYHGTYYTLWQVK